MERPNPGSEHRQATMYVTTQSLAATAERVDGVRRIRRSDDAKGC
jgi:hypothetical protein